MRSTWSSSSPDGVDAIISNNPFAPSPPLHDNEEDFKAAFGPKEMAYLAVVCHGVDRRTKHDFKEFVAKYEHVLRKFRLTGTSSTMELIAEVFNANNKEEGVSDTFYFGGPTCHSGPLGGDWDLIFMMKYRMIGGLIIFQDSLCEQDPHISCLVRQAMFSSVLLAATPDMAINVTEVFREALTGDGTPELLPSFFFPPPVQQQNQHTPTVVVHDVDDDVEKRDDRVVENNKKSVNHHPRAPPISDTGRTKMTVAAHSA